MIFFAFLVQFHSAVVILPSGYTLDQYKAIIQSAYAQLENSLPSVSFELADENGTLYRDTFGVANAEANISADNDTLYEWGSVTKLITHTAIMKLYQEGKVNFNDGIEKWLGKKFLHRTNYKDRITLLNLMNHDAGFDEVLINSYQIENKSYGSLYDYLYHVQPHQFAPPGQQVSYSNYGVSLEGLIVERVSGVEYWKYVQENIFKPLGIEHTSVDPLRRDVAFNESKYAIGYLNYAQRIRVEPEGMKILLAPAGAALGPVYDLSAFLREFIPGCNKILNDTTLDLFFTNTHDIIPKVGEKKFPGIAHGWWETYGGTNFDTLGFTHGGNSGYHTAFAGVLREKKLTLSFLSNVPSEHGFCHNLIILAFGGIVNKSSEGNPDKNKYLEGSYVHSRVVHSGFGKYMMFMNSYSAKGYTEDQGQKLNMSAILLHLAENADIPYYEIFPNTYYNMDMYNYLAPTYDANGQVVALFGLFENLTRFSDKYNKSLHDYQKYNNRYAKYKTPILMMTIVMWVVGFFFFLNELPMINKEAFSIWALGIVLVTWLFSSMSSLMWYLQYDKVQDLINNSTGTQYLVLERNVRNIQTLVFMPYTMYFVIFVLFVVGLIIILKGNDKNSSASVAKNGLLLKIWNLALQINKRNLLFS